MPPKRFSLRIIFLFLLLLTCFSVRAQNHYVDSLKNVLKTGPDDTNKVIALYRLCAEYLYVDSKVSLDYGNRAKDMAEKLHFKRGIGSACNNLGLAYTNLGQYDKAAGYYFQAIKIKEEMQTLSSLASVYGNLGGVFDVQGNYAKAEIYYRKAFDIGVKLKDKSIMAYADQNLGILNMERSNMAEGIRYTRLAMSLFYDLGDSLAFADNVNNMGVIYADRKNYDSAAIYYQRALAIRKRADDKMDLANSYNNVAGLFLSLGKYKEAEENFFIGLENAKATNVLPNLQSCYRGLAELYDSLHDYKSAYKYQTLFMQVKDSLFNMNSSKEIAVLEFKYEQEKVEKENEIRRQAEAREQKLILIFLIAITFLVSVFSIFLFNRFRLIRRQKTVIEVKTKEIVDSINYALRLQEAILPPQKLLKQLLPESFIFYRPKDIVAGDFYWLENFRDKIFFAAADCTGHGVPGAMVSIVCSNALTRCVKEFGIDEPGKILDKVRELVIQTFERSESEVKDGMDISLCCLEKDKMQLTFSGANNSLWIARKNEMMIWNSDHQPIGKFEMAKPFTTHNVKLEKGDCIYLGTDGYSDQFGGEKGKKFKTANLKNLLAANSDRSCKEQMQVLAMTFDKWKGNLEQVDDVCVFGVRI